jgi:hypothetical protein
MLKKELMELDLFVRNKLEITELFSEKMGYNVILGSSSISKRIISTIVQI